MDGQFDDAEEMEIECESIKIENQHQQQEEEAIVENSSCSQAKQEPKIAHDANATTIMNENVMTTTSRVALSSLQQQQQQHEETSPRATVYSSPPNHQGILASEYVIHVPEVVPQVPHPSIAVALENYMRAQSALLAHHNRMYQLPLHTALPSSSSSHSCAATTATVTDAARRQAETLVAMNEQAKIQGQQQLDEEQEVESDDSSSVSKPQSNNETTASALSMSTTAVAAAAVPAITRVPGVGDHDVLCGRGKGVNNTMGNRRFRDLVNSFRQAYTVATKRKYKRAICVRIIDIVHSRGGRFLVKPQPSTSATDSGEQGGNWVVLGREKVLAKVSQALRESGIAKTLEKQGTIMAAGATISIDNSALAMINQGTRRLRRHDNEDDETEDEPSSP